MGGPPHFDDRPDFDPDYDGHPDFDGHPDYDGHPDFDGPPDYDGPPEFDGPPGRGFPPGRGRGGEPGMFRGGRGPRFPRMMTGPGELAGKPSGGRARGVGQASVASYIHR